MHENERLNNKVEGHRDKTTKKQKFFGLLSSRIKLADTLYRSFLLLHAAEINDLPIQRICSRTNLDEKFCIIRFWKVYKKYLST